MSCLSVYPRKMITLIFNRKGVEFLDIHQLRRLIIKRKQHISDEICLELEQLNSDVSKELQNLRPSGITHSALEFRERMNIKYAQEIYKASGCSRR
jgi:predicted transcriptional regulator